MGTKTVDVLKTEITNIAIFRNVFAEVHLTEIMQIKSPELHSAVTRIADLTEITNFTNIEIVLKSCYRNCKYLYFCRIWNCMHFWT